MMRRLRAWFGVFLIFLFGVICGAILSAGAIQKEIRAWITGGSGKEPDPIVTYLRKELHLTPAQQAAARQIVIEARGRLNAVRLQAQPEVDRAVGDAERQVRALLDQKQAAHFDELVKKNHAKWQRNGAG